MKDEICSQWETSDLGDPTKIIGIKITQAENSITISQQKYIESILQHEHMECANPVATPLDPNVKIRPNPEGNEGSQSNSFAKLLGELQFLTNATRPDIAHTINRLAAYTAKSKPPTHRSLKTSTKVPSWNKKLRNNLLYFSWVYC